MSGPLLGAGMLGDLSKVKQPPGQLWHTDSAGRGLPGLVWVGSLASVRTGLF